MDFNHLAGLCQNLDTDSRGFKKYQLSSHFQGQNWKSLNLKIFLKLFSVQLVATFVPSWYKIYKERWNDGWRDENKRKPSVKLKFQNSYFEIISNRWSGTGPLSGFLQGLLRGLTPFIILFKFNSGFFVFRLPLMLVAPVGWWKK